MKENKLLSSEEFLTSGIILLSSFYLELEFNKEFI